MGGDAGVGSRGSGSLIDAQEKTRLTTQSHSDYDIEEQQIGKRIHQPYKAPANWAPALVYIDARLGRQRPSHPP